MVRPMVRVILSHFLHPSRLVSRRDITNLAQRFNAGVYDAFNRPYGTRILITHSVPPLKRWANLELSLRDMQPFRLFHARSF